MLEPSMSCTLLSLLFLCAARVMAYPIGISLGETYLTSAYYTQDDRLVPVARVTASEEWRLYFAKTWKDPKSLGFLNNSEVRILFKNTLHQAQKATETVLDHTITINSIIAPEHFSMTPSMRLLQEIAVKGGILDRYHQVAPALNGARLAYNLDSCEGFELEPDKKCNINGCNFIMIVSYERNRLSLSMVDVGLYVCQPYNIANYSQYGEANGSILDEYIYKSFSNDLKRYLKQFALDMEFDWKIKEALTDLRAIVLSGDASDSGMAEIRRAFATALPEYQNKFRMTLDPHFIGAFGAAQRARHIIQNPDFMRPEDLGLTLRPPNSYDGHIEL